MPTELSDRKPNWSRPKSCAAAAVSIGAGKKVLLVTRAGAFGGTEKHVIELVRRLGRRSSPAAIVCLDKDLYSARLQDELKVQVSVRSEQSLRSFWAWFCMCREMRPDVIVFVQGWLWSLPWYAYLAGRLAGVNRRIAIDHLIPPAAPPPVVGKSLRSVLRRLVGWRRRYLLKLRATGYLCDRTICVSDAVRSALVQDYGFPAQKTVTIHNGVALGEYSTIPTVGSALRARLGLHPEDFVLLCTARLTEVKGVDILLQAIALLLQRCANCKCIVVGDGPLKDRLSQQSAALGLTDSVRFEGFKDDVRPYLHASNAFVLTSYAEGLPIAVLEAMACGLPCVVTNVGGNSEAISHMVEGMLVSPGSAEEVADAISYLLRHPEECVRMSRMARLKVCEKFDIDRNMAEIEQAILE